MSEFEELRSKVASLIHRWELHALWVESTFMPGPNSSATVVVYSECIEDLRDLLESVSDSEGEQ